MRVISKKKLRDFWSVQANSRRTLEAWYRRLMAADWTSYQDLTREIPSADIVGDCVVFNIRRNDFRLIARIRFHSHLVYVLKVMTHAEYDRSDWKSECGCFTSPPARPVVKGKRKPAPGNQKKESN